MVGVEPDLLEVVADAADGVADRALDVEVGVRGDFADNHAEALGDGGLASHARVGILREHAVQDRVGDLVADLVGMTFSDRFGGQKKRARGTEGSSHNSRRSYRSTRSTPQTTALRVTRRNVGSNTMKRLGVGVAILLLSACDAPWDGPTLPDGSTRLSLTLITNEGPIGMSPNILASTSLSQLRGEVTSLPSGTNRTRAQLCQGYSGSDPCWNRQVDRPGRLYLAVITTPQCTSPTKNASAIAGHTLYYIEWVGHAQRTCGAAQAWPSWSLFSASRSDLPSSGTLTVRLQFQGTAEGGVESQAALT